MMVSSASSYQKSICALILKKRGWSTLVGVSQLPLGMVADGSTP
jgi:hypothetical protein